MPNEPALQPIRADRPDGLAIRNATVFPWPRSDQTATGSGRFGSAKTETAGSWLSIPVSLRKPGEGQFQPHQLVPPTASERKSPRCDLLHKGLRRPALNRQNGSGNPPIIAYHAFGHPHRLCLDRNGDSRRSARAGLSHPDLTTFPFPPDTYSWIFSIDRAGESSSG